MRLKRSCLSSVLVLAFTVGGIEVASPAAADCDGNGVATVCAQGDVRGGGPTPPTAGYPSYCADPWYCDDGWGLDVIVPVPPRPIRPRPPGGGGGGGIGPR
ncbi:hypothetical protein M2432_003439 [Mycobacterium sp. OTB74]|nr:hypothetical protein [Mycobacterium sp. OTB74]MDH6245786.1 hypothetical protein [Mycobacterium sp. OTB74]